MKIKFLFIFGTRPEAIKLAPLIQELKKMKWADVTVLNTGQHKELLNQVFDIFDIKVDFDLNVMTQNQTLSYLSSKLLSSIDEIILNKKPDMSIVQGDTTSAMIGSLASFYRKVPICHVEAGLRTYDMNNPFPEELNRVLISKLARLHFCPTKDSFQNLVNEGVSPSNIFITGNTGIDSLMHTLKNEPQLPIAINPEHRVILITAHRRESFGSPFINICEAIRYLALNNNDVTFLFPIHPNPNVKEVSKKQLEGISNIILCEPLGYSAFIAAMERSYLILTDSGGVQEEAPALSKPVLVLRKDTERKEAINDGVAKLVGFESINIIREVELLLKNKDLYATMSKGSSPYGDGHASARITNELKLFFNK